MDEIEVLYDFDWLQIVKSESLASLIHTSSKGTTRFNHKWKTAETKYYIRINGMNVAEIPVLNVQALAKALENIINGAQMKAVRENQLPKLIAKTSKVSVEVKTQCQDEDSLVAESVTDDMPHF